MSFDLFYEPCRYSKDSQSECCNKPLQAQELFAVCDLLQRSVAQGPDEFGCWVLDTRDGGTAEVFAKKLESGCMVSVRAMTPELNLFLYELLQAGNWVTHAGEVSIALSADHIRGTPEGYPRIVICDSAHEFGLLLAEGYGAWKDYRNQVCGDTEQLHEDQ